MFLNDECRVKHNNSKQTDEAILQPPADLAAQVTSALIEDVGGGDITGQLIAETHHCEAVLTCREAAVLCGQPWVNETFHQIGGDLNISWLVQEGDSIKADTICARLSGPARQLMAGERTALNFLQVLTATATLTNRFVKQLAGTEARLLDTRKTIPGLRTAQKYAVRCGGGHNHRMGLFDRFLIKENHISAIGGIAQAVQQARARLPATLLEIEVETLNELKEACATVPDMILLDNFSLSDMRSAVEAADGIPLEASGNITENNLVAIAATGVNFISAGALTKNIQATDFSLRVI